MSSMPDQDEIVDVAIVGAGAIGACIALECARAGASVVVIDAREGWGEGCSSGNAGGITHSHAAPFATPGDLFRALRWLTKPDSPFGISLSPALLPWLARFLRYTLDRSHLTLVTDTLADLARESLSLHEAYAAEGFSSGYEHRGVLDVYESPAGFRKGRRAAEAVVGPEAGSVLSEREVRDIEPLLQGPLIGGVLHDEDAHCDPLGFVQAVGAGAELAGARLVPRQRVTSMHRGPNGVELRSNEWNFRARTAVIANGASMAELIPSIPVVAGIGCSVDLASDGDTPLPSRPLMLHEARVVATPLAGRLRFAGTMLIDRDPERVPDPRRAASVYAAGVRALPAWAVNTQAPAWVGARACTFDALPAIGWADDDHRMIVAGGHGMLGLTLAPITAQFVRQMLAGKDDDRLAIVDPRRWDR